METERNGYLAPVGVGTELKKLLSAWGFREREGCNCVNYALEMNIQGLEWCENNIDTIISWLQTSAKERKLPFSKFVAKQFIRRSIETLKRKSSLMETLETFEQVFCVNLNARKDRWKAFKQNLPDDWPFKPVKRFPAITGKRCKSPSWWNQGNGAWGCYRSHLSILENALNRGINSVLFLEDDARFCEDFATKVKAFLDNLPKDWGMVYFGGQHLEVNKNAPKKVSENVYIPYNVNRTHAFGIRGKMLEVVYKHLNEVQNWPNGHHIDHHLGTLHKLRKHPIYTPGEWLVSQGEGRSDIACRDVPERKWVDASRLTSFFPEQLKFVVILGVHNSGSSVIAGLCYHLGIHLGNDLVGYYGNDPTNRCGFEAVGLRDICEKAIPFPATDYAKPKGWIWGNLKTWIRQKQREAWNQRRLAGGKYPLLCRCENQLWNICGENLMVINCNRPLEESIKGLIRRQQRSSDPIMRDAEQLTKHQQWLHEGKEILISKLPKKNVLDIGYSDVLENPIEEANKISEFLHVPISSQAIQRIKKMVDPSQRHIGGSHGA